MSRNYDTPCYAGPTSLNSKPLLSYNVLECVSYRYEFTMRRGLHDNAPLSQSLLQLLPGIVVTNKDTCVQSYV